MEILGNKVPVNPPGDVFIIGEVDKTMSGNTFIRVGKLVESGWERVAHITLTPEERADLITILSVDCLMTRSPATDGAGKHWTRCEYHGRDTMNRLDCDPYKGR